VLPGEARIGGLVEPAAHARRRQPHRRAVAADHLARQLRADRGTAAEEGWRMLHPARQVGVHQVATVRIDVVQPGQQRCARVGAQVGGFGGDQVWLWVGFDDVLGRAGVGAAHAQHHAGCARRERESPRVGGVEHSELGQLVEDGVQVHGRARWRRVEGGDRTGLGSRPVARHWRSSGSARRHAEGVEVAELAQPRDPALAAWTGPGPATPVTVEERVAHEGI
jgi:hypothetical protein